jgi:GNAT superfamily N-acetyltransferase
VPADDDLMRIELFDRQHNREGFDCGEPALNDFLNLYASQQQKRNLNRIYVATDDAGAVKGFYCLSAASIAFNELPEDLARRLPRYPIPAVLLGRFAVDRNCQGQGLGRDLLAHALARVCEAAQLIGVAFVVVDAKSEKAADFYRRLGFVSLPDRSMTLVLPVASVAAATQ